EWLIPEKIFLCFLCERSKPETSAVISARTIFPKPFIMLPGRISHIGIPSIPGILIVEKRHQMIAMNFGQNGGRCNGSRAVIAPHHAAIGYGGGFRKAVAVHQQIIGLSS